VEVRVPESWRPLRVAFVGITRSFQELDPGYVGRFVQYHLEIPYYYAKYGRNDVYVTSVDLTGWSEKFDTGGSINVIFESQLDDSFDVVVHWRSWRDDLYRPGAHNLLHTCDHTYPQKWKNDVGQALESDRLDKIICYRTWHARNMAENEIPFLLKTRFPDRVLTDLTLGVDTDIYRPSPDKDPFNLLWSSDPGRGLDRAIPVALELFQKHDRRYRLHVCFPDYVPRDSVRVRHPAIVVHGNVPNGPALWEMFNVAGFVPYTSTFKEPSSRAHRQGQAAGACVLYPDDMGSPSELIESFQNGVTVSSYYDPGHWARMIHQLQVSGEWAVIGRQAREFAETESWAVQAERFNGLFA
jgi:hypothetical protein